MDFEMYNDMLSTKEDIDKYLSGKDREFSRLSVKLIGIGNVVSVENVEILSSLPELQAEMERLSSQYLYAKKAADAMKKILTEFQIGIQASKSIEAYNMLKKEIEEKGIIKSSNIKNEDDINRLKLK